MIQNSLETTFEITKLIKKLLQWGGKLKNIKTTIEQEEVVTGSKYIMEGGVGDDIHDIILVTIFTIHFSVCCCL